MKFGVRECANIVFRAKTPTNIGKYKFKAGQPVLYIDTATTSTVEQASTAVYAQGGRGNVRLISWEGEKTLTFTVEDALLSPISLAMLSGADLFQGSETVKKVHFHTTSVATLKVSQDGNKATIDLSSVLGEKETLCPSNDSPIYVVITEGDGSLTGEIIEGTEVKVGSISNGTFTAATSPYNGVYQAIEITNPRSTGVQSWAADEGTNLTPKGEYTVFVDYYLDKKATAVDELQIAADNFAGNYYVEADTLFRRKSDGVDMPANLTFPNVKIQSNFTFSLSGTGDPSTFTFTMDALPGYTYFDKTREVLCVIQVIEDQTNADKVVQPVMPHDESLQHESDEIDDIHYIGFGGNNPTKGNIAITFEKSSYTVAPEGNITPVATPSGLATGETITNKEYSIGNSAIATVTDAGVVTGVAVGTTTLTVTGKSSVTQKEVSDTTTIVVAVAD